MNSHTIFPGISVDMSHGPHLKLRDTARQKKFLEADSISKIISSQ